MKAFGYTFEDVENMTREQIHWLITGLQVDSKEKQSAQRRSKLMRKG